MRRIKALRITTFHRAAILRLLLAACTPAIRHKRIFGSSGSLAENRGAATSGKGGRKGISLD